MWPRARDQKLFASLLGTLTALAWISLVIWKYSPYGRFLSHQQNENVHSLGSQYVVLVVLFVTGWTLMTVAMMLPTSLPLVMLFRGLVRKRPDHLGLVALLIFGYLGVWTFFGLVAHAGDLGVHKVVDQIGWLHDHAWVIGAGTVLWAGVYQFTPLKYHCLEKCRSPMSFVMEHWHGGNRHMEAFRLGLRHGLFCLGCCWSLMLLMFAVGAGSIGWMLALGAVMAVEKNVSWGRRLSPALGAGLATCGLILFALRTGLPGAGA